VNRVPGCACAGCSALIWFARLGAVVAALVVFPEVAKCVSWRAVHRPADTVAVLFILALCSLRVGLTLFAREIFLTVRLGRMPAQR
jgi:hypothetical protein